jgi:hypothetical protein
MLRDLQKFFQISTCDNPRGIFALASFEGLVSVASPNIQKGTVHIARFRNGKIAENDKPVVV